MQETCLGNAKIDFLRFQAEGDRAEVKVIQYPAALNLSQAEICRDSFTACNLPMFKK